MTGIAELLRGVGSQPSETPPPLWDVPGVEPDFDVIVVGGGVAGAVAAYELAGEGHEVLLVERGREPGSKISQEVFFTVGSLRRYFRTSFEMLRSSARSFATN